MFMVFNITQHVA